MILHVIGSFSEDILPGYLEKQLQDIASGVRITNLYFTAIALFRFIYLLLLKFCCILGAPPDMKM